MPPSGTKLREEIVSLVREALDEALPREWLTTEQAARYLQCSVQHLEIGRAKGNKGLPPYSKKGRLVRYKRADLDGWLEAAKVVRETLAGAA